MYFHRLHHLWKHSDYLVTYCIQSYLLIALLAQVYIQFLELGVNRKVVGNVHYLRLSEMT